MSEVMNVGVMNVGQSLGTPLWMDSFWEETTAAGVIAQVDTILNSVHNSVGGAVVAIVKHLLL